MNSLQLIATGGALPGRTVTNQDLSRTVDTSDEWITTRTGIRTRHYCTEEENAATLAIRAARQALERSGLQPEQIGCCVCATLSAPDATPSVACQVQAALGLPEDRPALDVNAAVVDGLERFDFNVTHHAHFVCERCHAVIDVDLSPPEGLCEQVTCGRVGSCTLSFSGICNHCIRTDAEQ